MYCTYCNFAFSPADTFFSPLNVASVLSDLVTWSAGDGDGIKKQGEEMSLCSPRRLRQIRTGAGRQILELRDRVIAISLGA